MNIYLTSLLTIFIYMVCWFFLAQMRKNNGIVDIAWGMGFVAIALVTYFNFGNGLPGQSLFLLMVAIWGFRLAAYIFARGFGQEEDWRYKKWREDWGDKVVLIAFFRVFMLQGAFMFIVSLPILAVMGATDRLHLGWQEMLGLGVWLFGFLWESISDQQLYNFKKKAENKGKIMTSGLWAYSRHPNYFGEIVLWWGFFIFCFPYGNWGISIIGPIIMTWLLMRISGVPMLEKKYKGNAEYDAYKERTNALLPKLW